MDRMPIIRTFEYPVNTAEGLDYTFGRLTVKCNIHNKVITLLITSLGEYDPRMMYEKFTDTYLEKCYWSLLKMCHLAEVPPTMEIYEDLHNYSYNDSPDGM